MQLIPGWELKQKDLLLMKSTDHLTMQLIPGWELKLYQRNTGTKSRQTYNAANSRMGIETP